VSEVAGVHNVGPCQLVLSQERYPCIDSLMVPTSPSLTNQARSRPTKGAEFAGNGKVDTGS
jgi:hypothetical protein